MSDITDITIYYPDGSVLMTVPLQGDAESVSELMRSDYVQLDWNASGGDTLPAGAYIMHDGCKYSLLDPYTPEQVDELQHTYTPQFHSKVMGWGKIPYFHYNNATNVNLPDKEPDWSLTDTAVNHLRSICTSLKQETGETWALAVSDDLNASGAKTVSFQSADMLSALNAIASEFDAEWWADEATHTISLAKRAAFGDPVTLTVGDNVGVPSVTESKEGYYNRFYVFGSTRNVTQDATGADVNTLVNKRLTLASDTYPGGYIDTREDQNEPVLSKLLIFDDVYPRAHLEIPTGGLVSRLMYRNDPNDESMPKVVGYDKDGNPIYDQYVVWYFKAIVSDTGKQLTINPTTYNPVDNPDGQLLKGKTLSVHFSSGTLIDREFELRYIEKAETIAGQSYSNGVKAPDFSVEAGWFEIKHVEEGNMIIPTSAAGGIAPHDGDKLILFNLRMPGEYTASSQTELAKVAMDAINERYTADLNNYTLPSNPVAFVSDDPELKPGRAITYVNGGYTLSTRVIKVVKKLDSPGLCEQEITIGSEKIKGERQTLKEEVQDANRNIEVLAAMNSLTDTITQQYMRTQQAVLEGFRRISDMWRFDPDHPDTIYSKYNVYSRKGMSAKGRNVGDDSGDTGGSLYGLMRSWPTADPGKATNDALGANLGWELKQRIDGLPTTSVNPYALTFGSKQYDGSAAATITAADLGALTSHQALHTLTLQRNGVTVGTFKPDADETLNINAATGITVPAGLAASALTPAGVIAITYADGYAIPAIAKQTQWDAVYNWYAGITAADTDGIINKWGEIISFLGGISDTSTLDGLLDGIATDIATKADKTITISAGAGLTGGGNLSANRTLALAASGVTAGTYPKVTVDAYGRVTAGASLTASDIPALSISKITGLQTSLDSKLDKSVFDDLFTKEPDGKGGYRIRANYGLYSNQYISAKGSNPGDGSSGGGGSSYGRLDDWSKYVESSGEVLSAKLGVDLNTRLTKLTTAVDGIKGLEAVVTPSTYTKVDVDKYGRVVAGSSLSAADIPALDWSKIATGKPTTLAGYGITDALRFSLMDGYLAARFADVALARKAQTTYIELWQNTLQSGEATVPNDGWFNLKAGKFITQGGTASMFVKGDGTLDSNVYALASQIPTNYVTTNTEQTITAMKRFNSGMFTAAIFHGTTSGAAIGFRTSDDKQLGFYAFNSANNPGFYKSDGSTFVKFLSAENYSSILDGRYAKLSSPNDLMHSSNEFTFAKSGHQGYIYINYRTASGNPDGGISSYNFCDGAGNVLASISAGAFSGNARTATLLQTARTFWGQPFNGDTNVSGNMADVGNITASATDTYDIGTSANQFRRVYANGIYAKTGGWLGLGANNADHIRITVDGNVGIGNTSPAYKLDVAGTFRATGRAILQSLQIGDCVISYDAENGGLKFSHGIYSEKYVSAKGQNTAGGSSTGGGSLYGLMRDWPTVDPGKNTTDALGANLGYDLNTRLATATSNITALTSRIGAVEGQYVTALGTSGDALTWAKNGVANSVTVPYASAATLLRIPDTRNANDLFSAMRHGITAHLKYCSVVDLPTGSDFAAVVNVKPWDDVSGGNAHQLAFHGDRNMYHRMALSDGTFTVWQKLLTAGNFADTLDARYLQLSGGTMANTDLVTNLNAQYVNGFSENSLRTRVLGFNYFQGTSATEGYDLNTLLESGGMTAQYGSMYYWKNAPAGMQYGAAICFKPYGYNYLKGMLAWDINHAEANGNYTRGLYWRIYSGHGSASGTMGWGQWRQVAFMDALTWSNLLNKPTTIAGYGITDGITATVAASTYVKKSGDMMTGSLVIGDGSANAVRLVTASDKVGWLQLGEQTSGKGAISAINGVPMLSLDIRCANNALTTNGNKLWHSGNDGAGSGLDADTLDGYHAGFANGCVPVYAPLPSAGNLVALGYNTEANLNDTESYLKGICKWAIDTYAQKGNILLIGVGQPNSLGNLQLQLYSNDSKNATTGLPKYCSGFYLNLGGHMVIFGATNYVWYYGGSINANAVSANKLLTARAINGTNFDGTAAITTAKWGTARSIYLRDYTGTHTSVAASVDGSADAYLKMPSNIDVDILTAKTAWAQTFRAQGDYGRVVMYAGYSVRENEILAIEGEHLDGTWACNILKADINGNVAFGAVPVDPAYKVVVGGDMKVTGSLGDITLHQITFTGEDDNTSTTVYQDDVDEMLYFDGYTGFLGGFYVPSNRYVRIGSASLRYNSTEKRLEITGDVMINGNIYSAKAVSAKQ